MRLAVVSILPCIVLPFVMTGCSPDANATVEVADTTERPATELSLVVEAPKSQLVTESSPANGLDLETAVPSARLRLSLDRDPNTRPNNTIIVNIVATRPDGQPWLGLAMKVSVSVGTVSAVRDNRDGSYTATVTPPPSSIAENLAWSGEVEITARIQGTDRIVERTAVVLPFVDRGWRQPEMVPGLVNTPGWEDSVEVSPDGKWLIVSTYFPVDLSRCEAGSPSSAPGANNVIGPCQEPQRPGLFGADRILSRSEIRHESPSLGLTEAMGLALPPAAAFGFRRQPDGSFAEPFVIGFDMNGYPWGGPFAFTFVGLPQDNRAKLMFSWDDFTDSPDTGIDQYMVEAKLGEPIVLGTYKWNTQRKVTVRSGFSATRLTLDGFGTGTPSRQSNGHFAGGWLWFDDETVSDNIWMTKPTDPSPSTTWSRPQTVPRVSDLSEPKGQPFFASPVLYFTTASRNRMAIYSAELQGTDPTKESSWTAAKPELVGEVADWKSGRTGAIVGLGESSIAQPNADETWLYFVYIRKTASGVDASVGRVRRR